MIVGCSGSGKSTLAHQISQLTDLPIIHLDQHYFNPGWNEIPREEFIELHKQLIEKDEWIIDGNYLVTMNERIKEADTIIFLNRPTLLCLLRIIKRFLSGTRIDPITGCKEQLEWEFVHYVLMYNFKTRPRVLDVVRKVNSSQNLYVLKSEKEVNRFIQELHD